jgi:hypothetical protein
MGNICEIISRPFKDEQVIVVGTPIQNPQVIVQQPIIYNDPGLSMANGFLTGMLIEDILD